MNNVQWIKLSTDVFDNRKIKQIEAMPEGDAILVVWFKLLVLAGKTNDSGMIYFTEDISYTEEMLSTEFRKPLNIVRLALTTFEGFGMIEIIDDVLRLPGWDKYQSVDGLEKIREQNRERKRRQRERQKALGESSSETLPMPKEKKTLPSEKKEIYELFEGYDITNDKIDALMERLKKNTQHLKCDDEEDDYWRLYDEMSDLLILAKERNAKYIYAWMKKVIDTTDFQRREPDYTRWGL